MTFKLKPILETIASLNMFIVAFILLYIMKLLLFNMYTLPIFIIYTIYGFYDDIAFTGGRSPKYWVEMLDKVFLVHYLYDYFPMKLVLDEYKNASNEKANIFGLHPHGVLGISHLSSFNSSVSKFQSELPSVEYRTATLNLNFYIPLFREMVLWRGLISADKSSLQRALRDGKSVGVAVGGARESLYAYPGKNTLVLSTRKGFIKLAIQTGANLVPVYAFGENSIYWSVQHPILKSIQDILTKYLSFAPVVFYGRFGTLIPRRVPVTTVVGSPIPVEQNDNPSQCDIDTLHSAYIESLTLLFNKYKSEYDPDGEDLVIL